MRSTSPASRPFRSPPFFAELPAGALPGFGVEPLLSSLLLPQPATTKARAALAATAARHAPIVIQALLQVCPNLTSRAERGAGWWTTLDGNCPRRVPKQGSMVRYGP